MTRHPDDDDLKLWQKVMQGVTPWHNHKQKKNITAGPSRPAGPVRTPKSKTAGQKPTPIAEKQSFATAPALSDDDRITAGLDRRSSEKLRRGKYPIDARLDLHGMDRIDAHDALISFIKRQHNRGSRCVLIITGKGSGILRGSLKKWLNETNLRQCILAYRTAQPKDGGSGAFYVLLKRQKNAK